MLKRSARGHDKEGAIATQPGECAVLCPACPHKFTLPDDYKNCPIKRRFLYTLFIALDANFRLKRRKISSEIADPGLSKGWAYFVEESVFKLFLREYDSKIIQEVFFF